MTGRLPVLRAREVIKTLQRAGFVVVRTVGSHKVLDHRDDQTRTVIVPDHGSKDMKPGTLRAIIKQSGLTVDEFRDLLKS